MQEGVVFDWERLGDIAEGRKNLGQEMPIAVYRLLQYTLYDVLEDKLGTPAANELFFAAGFKAGQSFAHNLLNLKADFSGFVADLQQQLKNLKIGILRIEKSNLETLELQMTVSEDLDCSGLPVSGDMVCVYDEGFIAGILGTYTGRKFEVKEIDCWASGDRTCRFVAKAL